MRIAAAIILFWTTIAQCEILVNSELNLRVFPSIYDGAYSYYEVDLNSDGTADLAFEGQFTRESFGPFAGKVRYSLLVTSQANTELLCFNAPQGFEEPYYTVFATVPHSSEIPSSPDAPFYSWESGSFNYDPVVGWAISSRNSYLAVRISDGVGYQYGWVHLVFPEEHERHHSHSDEFEHIAVTGLVKVVSTGLEQTTDKALTTGEGEIATSFPSRESLRFGDSEGQSLVLENVGGKICEIESSPNLETWDRVTVIAPTSKMEYQIQHSKEREFYRVLVSENME